FSFLMLIFLGACVASPHKRSFIADETARAHGWARVDIHAPPFSLVAYDVPRGQSDVLTVFIGGDGMVWANGLPPVDPTPRDPLVLRMALAHPYGAAAYLARPCQYL